MSCIECKEARKSNKKGYVGCLYFSMSMESGDNVLEDMIKHNFISNDYQTGKIYKTITPLLTITEDSKTNDGILVKENDICDRFDWIKEQ